MMIKKSEIEEMTEEARNTELYSVWNKNLSEQDHQILEMTMKFFKQLSDTGEMDS